VLNRIVHELGIDVSVQWGEPPREEDIAGTGPTVDEPRPQEIAIAGPADEPEEGFAPTVHHVRGAFDTLMGQLVEDGYDVDEVLGALGQRVDELKAQRKKETV
jgi:hypothetical protein